MNYLPLFTVAYRFKRAFSPFQPRIRGEFSGSQTVISQCDELVNEAYLLSGPNEVARLTGSIEELTLQIMPHLHGKDVDRLLAELTVLKIDQEQCKRRSAIDDLIKRTRRHILVIACDLKEATMRVSSHAA